MGNRAIREKKSLQSAELAKQAMDQRDALAMLLQATWIPGSSHWRGYFVRYEGDRDRFFNREGVEIDNPFSRVPLGETS